MSAIRWQIIRMFVLGAVLLSLAASTRAQTVAPHDLQNMTDKPLFAFWARPSEHLKNPVLAALHNEIKDMPGRARDREIFAAFPKIDSIKMSMGMARSNWSPEPEPVPVILFHTTDATSATALFKAMIGDFQEKTTPEWKTPIYTHKGYGRPGQEPQDPNAWKLQNGITQLDPQTIVQTDNIELMLKTLQPATTAAPAPVWANDFSQLAKAQTVWMVDLAQAREMLKGEQGPPGGMEALIFNNVKTLWEQADYAFISIDTTNGIQVTGISNSANAEAAQRFKGTIEGLVAIAKGTLPMAKRGTEQLNQMKPGMGDMLYTELENLVNSIKVTQAGTQTKLTLGIPQETLAKVPALLLPAIKSARAQAMKMQSMNNLKQIALALLNFHDVNRTFPAAVMLGPDGKTPHSWRVAILPYIEEQALYQQYKFDEPWDSENNKKVAATIPQVYRSMTATNGANCTSYVVLTHPNGVFTSTPGPGTKLRRISDGTSKTIAVVEANAEIPWTKPEDLPLVDGQPLPKLGTPGATTFNVAFCDGSVHQLSTKLTDEFRKLVTMNDGNIVKLEEFEPQEEGSLRPPQAPNGAPFDTGSPETKAAPAPAPPPAVPPPVIAPPRTAVPAPPGVPAPPRVNP